MENKKDASFCYLDIIKNNIFDLLIFLLGEFAINQICPQVLSVPIVVVGI
jgi:hypothetical protein